MTNTMNDRFAYLAPIAQQLREQGLIASVTHSGSINLSLPGHNDKVELWMSVVRGKGAFVRALGKRPFGLTDETLLKNPRGIADRVRECVLRRAAAKAAEAERVGRIEPLVASLNAAGFEASTEFDRVLGPRGTYGAHMRRNFSNTGVHVSFDVPVEKLALLKAFLDQLEGE